jgi:hypothetical protein
MIITITIIVASLLAYAILAAVKQADKELAEEYRSQLEIKADALHASIARRAYAHGPTRDDVYRRSAYGPCREDINEACTFLVNGYSTPPIPAPKKFPKLRRKKN